MEVEEVKETRLLKLSFAGVDDLLGTVPESFERPPDG